MKIHKYKAATEKEAMAQVRNELGIEALIVSVKHIKPRGLTRLFRKACIEVTAAKDDQNIGGFNGLPSIKLNASDVLLNSEKLTVSGDLNANTAEASNEVDEFKQFLERFSIKQEKKQEEHKSIVQSIQETLQEDLENNKNIFSTISQVEGTSIQDDKDKKETHGKIHIEEEPIEDTPTLKLIYEQLIDNEVAEPFANELMNGLAEHFVDHTPDIDDIVSIVYKRMVKYLSDIEVISTQANKGPVFFIGPTGVGKTTTIAKIASLHSLVYNRDVALITSDTYRIAAVEQLRTYANILGIPIKVVYTKEEMLEALEFLKDKDLVLIDTAGRSHKNKEHQNELYELLNSVMEKEVYLTLSVATKYRDLIKIAEVYQSVCKFNIIFTKLDETLSYGNILNIKMATEAKLSYITFGQNVPDDISEINPHKIAKNLLGGEDHGSSE
jgi:flagellar biosynthesis protein FlhF